MSVVVNIHAACVALDGKGVLLLGPSGCGKSDMALRLIDAGAKLVADDRCDLFARGGKLWARPPSSIAGLIELNGIGIVKMPHAKSAVLAMAVRLERGKTRLPEAAFYVPPAPLQGQGPVPLIRVDGHHAGAGARIRAALAAFSTRGFRDTFNLD